MGGGSLEVAEVADDRVGTGSVSLPLGALPVQALLAKRAGATRSAASTRSSGRAAAVAEAARRSTPSAGAGGPSPKCTWSPSRRRCGWHMDIRSMPARPAPSPERSGACPRRSWRRCRACRRVACPTLPAAALVLDRVLKRLAPERVVFSALGVREGWLYAQLATDEQNLDPLVEGAQSFGIPHARVAAFAPALVCWTEPCSRMRSPPERRLRVAACALSDIGWRDHASVKAAESFRRLHPVPPVSARPRRARLPRGGIHARYGGMPTIRHWRRRWTVAAERAAPGVILGRALLLGYRVSGGVPEILQGARLDLERIAFAFR